MNKIDNEVMTIRRRWLCAFAIIAITWAGLLIGMYLKYIPETTELGVRIFGSLRGAAFIRYILVIVVMARQQEWRLRWIALIALGPSVPPWGHWALILGPQAWAPEPNAERNAD